MPEFIDPEILIARRAMPEAQVELAALAPSLDRRLPDFTEVGWHDTAIGEPERGATAVVASDFVKVVSGQFEGPDDIVGEVLRVRYRKRSVLVYVVSIQAVPTQISLSRRAFAEIAPLWTDSLMASVEVLA